MHWYLIGYVIVFGLAAFLSWVEDSQEVRETWPKYKTPLRVGWAIAACLTVALMAAQGMSGKEFIGSTYVRRF
jgi:hypothetical protein